MQRGANQLSLGGFNQRVVLDVIRRQRRGVSRVEIARRTGLSTQTISNVTRRLLDAGLIEEAGSLVVGPGKPRTMLVPRADGLYAVGLHIDPAMIHGVVLDLEGEPRAALTTTSPHDFGPDRAPLELARLARSLVEQAGVGDELVAGVGVAVPGPLRGSVVVDPPLMPSWRGIDLRESLAAVLDWPVLVEKDVIASARGEMWLRKDATRDSFGFLYFGSGVGSGAVIHAQVQRGTTGNFGEIGHLLVRAFGQACPCCGTIGTLGLATRPATIVAEAAEAGAWDRPAPQTPAEVDGQLRGVCELATTDPRVTLILRQLGRDLGTAAALISDLWDLPEIVIGGPYWPIVEQVSLSTARETLQGRAVLASARPVRVCTAEAPHRVESVGAAALVFDEFLSPRSTILINPAGTSALARPGGTDPGPAPIAAAQP